jgi:hypothetical protein
MDMYRIEGEWVKGHMPLHGQTFELVAGFTPKSYIASGNWFGAVKDYQTIYPFVLTDDGHCRYAGDHSQTRYFSIVKRPVAVGEIFELTWDDHDDVHFYRITKVARLNLHSQSPDEEPYDHQAAKVDGTDEDDAEKAPGVFLKTSLVRDASRPEAFKATVESLIESGNVIAVGENAIERVFARAGSFGEWFDSIRVTKEE